MTNETLFTEEEKIILRSLPEQYKWIARDDTGLCIYCEKPKSRSEEKIFINAGSIYINIFIFEHIFKNVTWENSPICFREQVLNNAERKYLKNIIRPFYKNVTHIKKECGYYDSIPYPNGEQLKKKLFFENIEIWYLNEIRLAQTIILPAFEKGTKYIGMEIGKEYTLDDLGFNKQEFL